MNQFIYLNVLVVVTFSSLLAEAQDYTYTLDRLADAPTKRMGDGIAEAVGGKIYFIGGHEGSPGTGRFNEAFEISNNIWSSRTQIPHNDGRYAMGSAVYNGKIYIFGGVNSWGNYNTKTVDYYEPSTNSWFTDQGTYPLIISGLACITAGNYI